MNPVKEREAHVILSGDITGRYVVRDRLEDGELVIAPESEWQAMLDRMGAREATPAEFEAFEREHGPFLAPDGEG
jgi:hypothetical protein